MFTKCKHVRQRALPNPINDFRIRQGSRHVPVTAPWSMESWDAVQPSSYWRLHFGGTQITESDSNSWPPPKASAYAKKRKYLKKYGAMTDVGSEFYSQKKEIVSPTVMPYSFVVNAANPAEPTLQRCLEGSLIANCLVNSDLISPQWTGVAVQPLKYNWPPDMSSSRQALEVLGTKAIAASSPGNQVAAAASFMGELLQDVPRVPGVALWEAKLKAVASVAGVADEFLNYIFGIAPTIGDMGQFLTGVHKIDKAVDQLIRDSGRTVRRRFYFDETETQTSEVLPNVWSPATWARSVATPYTSSPYSNLAPSAGLMIPIRETTRVRTVNQKQWFSGAFTYYLPKWFDSHSERDRRRLMLKLFGAEPDLNTVWQLAPWSWAIDWFSNAGSFVKNLQSLRDYGTILRYGYMMETTTVTDTFTATGPYFSAGVAGLTQPYPYVTPVTLRVTTKKRVAANPFGFGLSWDGLSSTQQAIAAALGITRVLR